jgi:acetoin utilization protein AcuB
MLVQDWMSQSPVRVEPNTPVLRAKRLMGDNRCRRLPVVEDGRVVGIVTDRDLREFTPSKVSSLDVYEVHFVLDRLTVGDLMTRNVVTVSPKVAIEDAASLMCRHKIGGMPVVEDDLLVGVITETDIFRALVQVMGATRPGVRIEVEIPSGRGAVARIAAVLEELASEVLSFVTGPTRGPRETRVVTFRLGPTDAFLPERAEAALREAGAMVRDLRTIA